MTSRHVEFIYDILISVQANIRELQQRKAFADAVELDHIEGKLMAYREVLSIIEDSAREFGFPIPDTSR